jgi:hypothetical protein
VKDCDAFGSKHHEFNQSNFASLKMLILIKRKDRCFFYQGIEFFIFERFFYIGLVQRPTNHCEISSLPQLNMIEDQRFTDDPAYTTIMKT